MIVGFLLLTILCAGGVYFAFPRSKLTALCIALVYVCIVFYVLFINLPSAIQRSAESIAANQPYCISLPHLHRPVGQSLDLTLLRARGNKFTPHLLLWVKEPEGAIPYNWSYKKRRFERNFRIEVIQNCILRQGFLKTLKLPKPGAHFVMGKDTYIFPPEHDANHSNDDTIKLHFFIEGGIGRRSGWVRFNPASVDHWQRSELARISFPTNHPDIVKVENSNGFVIWKFDDSGLPIEQFGCNSRSVCRIEFIYDSKLFSVILPSIGAEEGSKVRSQIQDMWQSFRVERGPA